MPLRSPDIRNDTAPGLLRVLGAALTWGSIPIFLAMLPDVPSLVVVFWRVAISGLALLTFSLASGRIREFRAMSRRKLLGLAANGVLLGVNWVLFFSGLKLAGVAVGEILGYVGPVFVAALSPLVLHVAYDKRVVLPLMLALAGTVVIVAGTLGGAGYGPNVALGATLAGASSLTYSLLMLNSKRLLHGTSAVAIMTAENCVAAVMLLPAALLMPGPSSGREWGALAVLALVHTVFAGMLFVSGLRHVRADHAAILTYGEPVSAVVFGALLLHQPVTAPIVLGGAGVVAGGIMVARMGTGYGQEAPPAE